MPNSNNIDILSERVVELTTYNAKLTTHLENVHNIILTMTKKIEKLNDDYESLHLSVELMKKDVKTNETKWSNITDNIFKIVTGVLTCYILYRMGIGVQIP